jgi:N-acetylmuramoyl-L-alanine amidase
VQAGSVEGVRTWADGDKTRVVLDLSGPAEHRLFTLTGPDRIVVDLPRTAIDPKFSVGDSTGIVRRIRTGQRDDATSRIVLDVAAAVRTQSFLLEPDKDHGHRLVIDLTPTAGSHAEIRAPRPANPRGRDLVIAIDAGHGGKDPGASGTNGVREKDVVMQIARRLARELEAQPGFKPLLVRDSDSFVTLRERTEIARRAEADLFVSIHADAYRNTTARGATVYVLSSKGASDEAGRRLAERENGADLIGGVSLADQESDIASVILDITQTAALSASISAAEDIMRELGGITRLRKSEVQQAGFVVLKSPDIPSVLVETAYLSNPSEADALKSANHQAKLARALSSGIVRYFFENPPPGTYLAMNPQLTPQTPVRHAVARGETLSAIAQRYRVSIDRIISSNQLKNDRIRIGQVLTIPRT